MADGDAKRTTDISTRHFDGSGAFCLLSMLTVFYFEEIELPEFRVSFRFVVAVAAVCFASLGDKVCASSLLYSIPFDLQ